MKGSGETSLITRFGGYGGVGGLVALFSQILDIDENMIHQMTEIQTSLN